MTKKQKRKTELYVEILVKERYLFSDLIRSNDEELVKEFFKDFDINRFHAARDYYHIVGGDKIVKIGYRRIKSFKELKRHKLKEMK